MSKNRSIADLGNLNLTNKQEILVSGTNIKTINGESILGSGGFYVEDRKGTAIASAATTTIGTAGLGDYIHITGTTTISSFGTASAEGIRRTLIFDSALTLTHNATSLICPGATSIVTVANTVIEVVAETTTNWRVVSVTHPSISVTELSYLDGVTSNIQTQITGLRSTTAYSGSVSGTVTLNFTNGIHVLTLTGNITLANPTSMAVGASGMIIIKKTAAYTIAYGSYWKAPAGLPALTLAPTSTDILVYSCESTSVIHCAMLKNIL